MQLSPERLGTIGNLDALLLLSQDGKPSSLINTSVYQQLPVVKGGHTATLTTSQQNPLSYNTVLSIPAAIKQVVPTLARIVKR